MTSARTGACSFAHSTTFWVFAGTIHDALNAHQQSISSIVILTCACVTLHLHIFTHHPSPLAQGAGCQASDPASRWPGCDLQARGAAHHRPHTHPYRCPNDSNDRGEVGAYTPSCLRARHHTRCRLEAPQALHRPLEG